MSTTKPCPAPHCHEEIALTAVLCRADWKRCPKPLRQAVYSCVARQLPQERFDQAAAGVVAWITANPERREGVA